jgi:hypothetical protein
VAAGDKLDIEIVPTGGNNPSHVHYTTKFVGDTAKNTVLLGGNEADPSSYISLHGLESSGTEFGMETVFPTRGTLRDLYVDISTPRVRRKRHSD